MTIKANTKEILWKNFSKEVCTNAKYSKNSMWYKTREVGREILNQTHKYLQNRSEKGRNHKNILCILLTVIPLKFSENLFGIQQHIREAIKEIPQI